MLLQQCSPISFQVELPPTMRIHDVFHVDRFKPFIPLPESLGHCFLPPPKPEIVNGKAEYKVEAILAYRSRWRRMEFLIKWADYDAAKDSTWKPLKALANSSIILYKYCQEHGLLFLLGECHSTIVNPCLYIPYPPLCHPLNPFMPASQPLSASYHVYLNNPVFVQ
jgi:hypothetical protein